MERETIMIIAVFLALFCSGPLYSEIQKDADIGDGSLSPDTKKLAMFWLFLNSIWVYQAYKLW